VFWCPSETTKRYAIHVVRNLCANETVLVYNGRISSKLVKAHLRIATSRCKEVSGARAKRGLGSLVQSSPKVFRKVPKMFKS